MSKEWFYRQSLKAEEKARRTERLYGEKIKNNKEEIFMENKQAIKKDKHDNSIFGRAGTRWRFRNDPHDGGNLCHYVALHDSSAAEKAKGIAEFSECAQRGR